MTEFIKVSTAAKRLGVTRQRVYQMIEEGKFHKIEIDGGIYVDGSEVQSHKDENFVKSIDKLPERLDN